MKELELFEMTSRRVRENMGIRVEVENFLDDRQEPSDRFDLFILRDVLIHLADPTTAINQIRTRANKMDIRKIKLFQSLKYEIL